jgi:Glutamyl-tRNAGlu reductase, dimerisation domain
MPGFLTEIRQPRRPGSVAQALFGRNSLACSRGTGLAMLPGMSPIARVLHSRFEEICRAELVRLRRKTASLSASDQGELDAISLSVAHAIAARLGEALERDTAADTGNIVTHLFAVTLED